MSELIRRQDAELILAREMYATSLEDGCDPVSPMDFLPEARAWLSDAPTIGSWIPCSERLPEPYTDVLACWRDIRKGCEDDYCLITSWIEHGRWNSIADFVDMQVIAWQRLPEPYREDGE